MSQELTDLQLLHELEPVVEKQINRHLSMRKDWNPHDYIPWSDGKNFYALGGQEWHPEQSKLSEVARVAMVTNLLTDPKERESWPVMQAYNWVHAHAGRLRNAYEASIHREAPIPAGAPIDHVPQRRPEGG